MQTDATSSSTTATIPVKALLLDIEGTTSSISFVNDELFPYIRRTLSAYVESHWKEIVTDTLPSFIAECNERVARGELEDNEYTRVVAADHPDAKARFIANVLKQMDENRKTTCLKELQGKMWREGYEQGQFKGHIYADVLPVLRGIRAPIYIYSSGSVAAQHLLFRYSTYGDVLSLFRDHFDTANIGPKVVSSSYKKIAERIGTASTDVLFITDSIVEARAASDAGMRVLVSVRPGTEELPPVAEFPAIASFEQMFDHFTFVK